MFIRPLLCVDREQIIKYLQQRNLKWHRDHTNADCTYRRNYIRHKLLPSLQQNCTGSLVEQLSELSESARRFYKLLYRHADEVWSKTADCSHKNITLDIKTLLAQPQPIIVELLRRTLTSIGCGERNLTQYHYQKLLQLARQNTSGRKIDLPGEYVVSAEYGNLIFSHLEKKSLTTGLIEKSIKLQIPGQIRLGDYSIEAAVIQANEKEFNKLKVEKNSFIEWFDLNKIKHPLLIRSRKAGDRFVPLGLNKEKKVGKFITDARIPQQLRLKLLIVTDSEKIIWLWPVRTSDRTKVTNTTNKILQLRINDIQKIP
jgi:tRNA(Ile)-lysidine synthase